MISPTRQDYLKRYYDIWEDYYMDCCSAGQRDSALAALHVRYPNEKEPSDSIVDVEVGETTSGRISVTVINGEVSQSVSIDREQAARVRDRLIEVLKS